MPMLEIYPEKRIKAFECIFHDWIMHDINDKNHICTDPNQAAKNLEEFQAKMKSRCVFYRELKDFDEDLNDADSSFDQTEDTEDGDVGFRKGFWLTLERNPPEKKEKYMERNFASGYIGYDEGINVDGLDSTANWQF